MVLRGASVCQVPGCAHPDSPLDKSGGPGSPLYPTVDHVIPVSESESWSPSERDLALYDLRYLRPAHWECNSRRHNGPPLVETTVEPTREWCV